MNCRELIRAGENRPLFTENLRTDARRTGPTCSGNRFGLLKGDRKGQYSIRINDQWRLCFEWPEGSPGPVHVEVVDYH